MEYFYLPNWFEGDLLHTNIGESRCLIGEHLGGGGEGEGDIRRRLPETEEGALAVEQPEGALFRYLKKKILIQLVIHRC